RRRTSPSPASAPARATAGPRWRRRSPRSMRRAPRFTAERAPIGRPTLDSPQFPGGRAMTSAEVARERAYVHGLYARLDGIRDAVHRELDSVRGIGGGGTHQSRTERDAFARIYEDRLAQLREVDERLAFGR